MKKIQSENEVYDGTLAGVLVIAIFSMSIGVLLGFLIAS